MTRKYCFYKPHPALSSVVNNILIFHAKNELQTNVTFPFPPLPEHCILFYPFDRPFAEDINTKQLYQLYSCTIAGQHTERTVLSLGQNHLMIKIGFQPGALQRLLGLPMHEMIPCISYDGEDVFGQNVKYVTDAFANAASYEVMKEIADNFMLTLLQKIKKPNNIDFVIPLILRHGGMIKIDALVREACMSNRQFERVFKDRMGVSPKFYSRLVRFSKAWVFKEDNPNLTWTDIAYSCNYFDQMHLIRDFKEFANYNPSEISEAFKKQPFRLKNGIFH